MSNRNKYAAVEGHSGLVRDLETGAILNINTSEIQRAKERKIIRQQQKQREQNLYAEVDQLKEDVRDIKCLLTKIVEKL